VKRLGVADAGVRNSAIDTSMFVDGFGGLTTGW
jgi:hypothetical protein